MDAGFLVWGLPIVSIVVPFFGFTNSILRILKGNPKKELQWRLQVGCMRGLRRLRRPRLHRDLAIWGLVSVLLSSPLPKACK